MDRLVASGLSGSGLIPIRSSLLVRRYNDCLKAAGIDPTTLGAFDIDGKGWSPQIAVEKNNPFYLSHGGSIQFAIILSPDQEGKPVYKPYYSFERDVMDMVFKNHKNAIADLTSRSGVLIEIDPGVVRFDSPEDLLLVESVAIRFTDPVGLMNSAVKQEELVTRFKTGPRAWSDPVLQDAIIESAKANGDLRFRELIIPEIKVTDLDCFYSEVFGGTFVLRGRDAKNNPLLVVASKPYDTKQTFKRFYQFDDATLVQRLFDSKIVEIPVNWYREHPESLEDLWESILADALFSDGRNTVNFSGLSLVQKKKYAVELMDKLPSEFMDIERFMKRINSDIPEKDGEKKVMRVSKKLRTMLMRPHGKLKVSEAKVVWRLITRMTTVSLSDLYIYDKPTFFNVYPVWPEARQLWAIEHLKSRGLAPQGDRL